MSIAKKDIDVLSTYGPFTASGLAERLGESSGATSHHLRQLGRHDFVREVEGRGTGREVHPTAAQLAEFTNAFMVLLDDFLDKYRDQAVPGSRPVQIHFNAFPVIDGIEINAPSNDGGTA